MKVDRLCIPICWAAIVSMCVLMLARLYFAISFREPLQLITTVDEYASLFAIWKSINGLSVYVDPEKSPYAMAFFNVLFYKAYAQWTAFWLSSLSLTDSWLPTIGRVLTLIGSLTGWVVMTLSFQAMQNRLSAGKTVLSALLAPASATVLFIGPLTGFWSITVRPDIWAVVFEVFAVSLFLLLYDTRKTTSVLLAFAFLIVTWLIKQPSVSVICGIGLFLLIERQWRLLTIYTALFIVSWALVFGFGTDTYKGSILLSRIHLEYTLAHCLEVWLIGLVQALPVFVPLCAIIFGLLMSPAYRMRFMESWICRFFLIAFIASVAVVSVLSLQIGSQKNYLFPTVFLACGLLVSGYAVIPRQSSLMAAFKPLWVAAAGAHTVLCWLILTGNLSVVDAASKTHPVWINTATCINKLPKPIFVGDKYLSLPWMTESAEPFVLSYTYARARSQGLKLEGGGVGGRINNGEFATLVIAKSDHDGEYDGADLMNYTLQSTKCGSLNIWSRKNE